MVYLFIACCQHNVAHLVYTSTYNVVFGGQVIRNGDESLPYLPLDKVIIPCSNNNLRTLTHVIVHFRRGERNIVKFLISLFFPHFLPPPYLFGHFSLPRGGGGYSKKFYMGRLRPEVQPLTLLYTIFSEKAPLSYTFYWKKGSPFIYLLMNKLSKQEVFLSFFSRST